MSPLQFQRRLRLQEARRLPVAGDSRCRGRWIPGRLRRCVAVRPEQVKSRGGLDASVLGNKANLQRHDLSVRGREAIQEGVELAPGVSSARHWHPGEEIVYVLEGVLEYEVEGKQPVRLKAGEVLLMPARTVHAARNVGSVPGAELATYVVEKGKPLLVPVK